LPVVICCFAMGLPFGCYLLNDAGPLPRAAGA
jgi:hypothetical protein